MLFSTAPVADAYTAHSMLQDCFADNELQGERKHRASVEGKRGDDA